MVYEYNFFVRLFSNHGVFIAIIPFVQLIFLLLLLFFKFHLRSPKEPIKSNKASLWIDSLIQGALIVHLRSHTRIAINSDKAFSHNSDAMLAGLAIWRTSSVLLNSDGLLVLFRNQSKEPDCVKTYNFTQKETYNIYH